MPISISNRIAKEVFIMVIASVGRDSVSLAARILILRSQNANL